MFRKTISGILNFFGLSIRSRTKPSLVNEILNFLEPVEYQFKLFRAGSSGDGGYLIPNDVDGIRMWLSFGISNDWNFEKDISEKFGIPVRMFDYSIDTPIGLSEIVKFHKLYLGPSTGGINISIENILDSVNSEVVGDLLLKIDIEGAEYLSLISLNLESLSRFRIIVIEFHNFHKIYERDLFEMLFKPIFDQFRKEFYSCHFHPNNASGTFNSPKFGRFPKTFEVTLHRKDRIVGKPAGVILPSLLDSKNVSHKKDIKTRFK